MHFYLFLFVPCVIYLLIMNNGSIYHPANLESWYHYLPIISYRYYSCGRFYYDYYYYYWYWNKYFYHILFIPCVIYILIKNNGSIYLYANLESWYYFPILNVLISFLFFLSLLLNIELNIFIIYSFRLMCYNGSIYLLANIESWYHYLHVIFPSFPYLKYYEQ